MQRIVFLDVDGTIIDSLGRIAPTTPTAIAAARANGHRVLLCTGRAPADIHPDVTAIGFDGVVSTGGAFADVDGELMIERVMSAEDTAHLFDYFRSQSLPFFAQTHEHTYGDAAASDRLIAATEVVRRELAADGDPVVAAREALEVLSFEDAPADLYDHVAKTVFVGDSLSAYARVAADLGDRYHLVTGSIPMLGTACGEVSARGVNKGTTIEILLPRLGFTAEQAVGIGDSPNDLEMFAVCGTAIAMGNATDAVKAAAGTETTSVLEDGIHHAFLQLGLI